MESECQRSMYLNLWNADFNMISVCTATDELDLEHRLIEEVDKHDSLGEQNAVEVDVPWKEMRRVQRLGGPYGASLV